MNKKCLKVHCTLKERNVSSWSQEKMIPAVRVELPVQRKFFESVFSNVRVSFKRHGNIIKKPTIKPTIEDLSSNLGCKWNVRIKSING